jgi:hypothetical protein
MTEMGNRLYPFESFLASFSLLPLLFLLASYLVLNPFEKERWEKKFYQVKF